MNLIDIGLYFMYALLVVSVLAAIIFPLLYALQNPAGFFKSMIGVIAIIALFFICYAISDATVKPAWAVAGQTTASVKLVGAGLLTFYVVMTVAVAGLIFSEVNKALK